MAEKLNEVWEDSTAAWELSDLSESESVVDGKYVIGRVKGPFFVPNGISRNKRFYPRELWENSLNREDVQQRLRDKVMFGTIGHDDVPVSEKDLREGVVSHIITSLAISDQGKGIGEALILNTDAGRNLYTYLKAGAKLNTSSRASGSFKEGVTHEGVPVVDGSSYILETFDFVLRPGFLEAQPDLIEHLEDAVQESAMDKEVTEKLNEKLDALTTEVSGVKSLNEALQAKNDELVKQLETAQDTISEMQEAIQELTFLETFNVSESALNALMNKAQVFGVKDVPALARFLEQIDPKTLEAAEELREVGEDKLNALAEELETYRNLGTVEEINATSEKAHEYLKEYFSIGSPQEIKSTIDKTVEVLSEYQKLGTIEEIKEIMRRLEEAQRRMKIESQSQVCETWSKTYNVPVDVVQKMFRNMGNDADRVKEMLESMKIVTRPASRRTIVEEEIVDTRVQPESAAMRFFRQCGGSR